MSNKSAVDIRKAALNAEVPAEVVEIPEWGSSVTVRGLTAGAAVDFYAAASRPGGEIDRKLWAPGLLIACVFDMEGNAVFDKADRDHITTMPSSVVTRLATIAARLSGLAGEEEDKVVEDFEEDR